VRQSPVGAPIDIRAAAHPKCVAETFTKAAPQLPQVSIPENSVLGRRRSQNPSGFDAVR